MNSRSVLGLVFMILGALVLAYPVVTYTEKDRLIDIGPLEVTSETEESIPLPPVLGGVAIIAGAVLLVTGSGRKRT